MFIFIAPEDAYLGRWGVKDDPTSPLCHGKQTIEHVLSYYKVAGARGSTTVLQELAIPICDAKGLPVQPKERALVKYLHQKVGPILGGLAAIMDTQWKILVDECDDWDLFFDLFEWKKAPKSPKAQECGLSSYSLQIVMVELIVTYERRMEGANLWIETWEKLVINPRYCL
ncbi:reverse transcriptase [Plakobranchus ocellatus]|uniref:Reverse transcriptase n=1 Tax=Plakobranchus ocellatus TaxID=259542 RepID=A0AAV3ZT70_9GAST|nr:reverse transcriptase [Plakobranchus ocellatus]